MPRGLLCYLLVGVHCLADVLLDLLLDLAGCLGRLRAVSTAATMADRPEVVSRGAGCSPGFPGAGSVAAASPVDPPCGPPQPERRMLDRLGAGAVTAGPTGAGSGSGRCGSAPVGAGCSTGTGGVSEPGGRGLHRRGHGDPRRLATPPTAQPGGAPRRELRDARPGRRERRQLRSSYRSAGARRRFETVAPVDRAAGKRCALAATACAFIWRLLPRSASCITEWRSTGAATTDVAATAATVAATFAPPEKTRVFRSATSEPASPPVLSFLTTLFGVESSESARASERLAPPSCVSTAACKLELGRNLLVRKPLPLAQQQRATLLLASHQAPPATESARRCRRSATMATRPALRRDRPATRCDIDGTATAAAF